MYMNLYVCNTVKSLSIWPTQFPWVFVAPPAPAPALPQPIHIQAKFITIKLAVLCLMEQTHLVNSNRNVTAIINLTHGPIIVVDKN